MKSFWDANEKYGRAFLIASSLVIWLAILISFRENGYDETWRFWRVPVESPQFSDFRLIPGSAESFRMGFEPTQRNPSDPHKRIFNYPAFWRLFFYTGITQADTVWIGTLMIVLFFVGVFAFPGRLEMGDAFALLLVAFAPASMLLYERGNVDLIVFFLCVLIILALDYNAVAATALIMIATVVKIFPFFGVLVLFRETKSRSIWLALSCLGVLLGYTFATSKSMRAAWDLTMRGNDISYGANVLFLRYDRYFSELLHLPRTSDVMKFGPILLAFLLLATAGLAGVRRRASLTSHSARNLAAFRMGAGIYVGTFLLGNNWDYRLAFLILVVPQLLEWSRGSSLGRRRMISIIMLALVLVSCWHFVFWYSPSLMSAQELLFGVDEVANWVLMTGFGYLLVASAPDWSRDLFRFIPSKGGAN